MFEIPLINCEISLQLTCSKKRILAAGTAANQAANLYVPVVTPVVNSRWYKTIETIRIWF